MSDQQANAIARLLQVIYTHNLKIGESLEKIKDAVLDQQLILEEIRNVITGKEQ